jgi:hypothetical protein
VLAIQSGLVPPRLYAGLVVGVTKNEAWVIGSTVGRVVDTAQYPILDTLVSAKNGLAKPSVMLHVNVNTKRTITVEYLLHKIFFMLVI